LLVHAVTDVGGLYKRLSNAKRIHKSRFIHVHIPTLIWEIKYEISISKLVLKEARILGWLWKGTVRLKIYRKFLLK
jgi:hypothetical protein